MNTTANPKAPASEELFLDEKQQKTNFCPKDGGLWDIAQLMRHVPVCRRSISNLRKRGLPAIVLGRRVFFMPASVKDWLLRQERRSE